jgi:hypothetical protein
MHKHTHTHIHTHSDPVVVRPLQPQGRVAEFAIQLVTIVCSKKLVDLRLQSQRRRSQSLPGRSSISTCGTDGLGDPHPDLGAVISVQTLPIAGCCAPSLVVHERVNSPTMKEKTLCSEACLCMTGLFLTPARHCVGHWGWTLCVSSWQKWVCPQAIAGNPRNCHHPCGPLPCDVPLEGGHSGS